MSELVIDHVHACMLTGSVGKGMIRMWYLGCLEWWFLRVFTLRLYILVSIVFCQHPLAVQKTVDSALAFYTAVSCSRL